MHLYTMGKPKRAAPQKERKLSFINVCKSDSDGKPVFKASVVTDDKQLVVLGVFTSELAHEKQNREAISLILTPAMLLQVQKMQQKQQT